MAISSRIKSLVNRPLSLANMKLDTLTKEKAEAHRISRQKALGRFEQPDFPLLEGMSTFDGKMLANAYSSYKSDLDRMMQGAPPSNFDCSNHFFTTPDAEILYLMVRALSPNRIVEIGSGNSTKIVRQAIIDGGLTVNHIAIDPEPRSDIAGLTDKVLRSRFEEVDVSEELEQLATNDILFIDSSHLVNVANDVVNLFCKVIPRLKSGVAVHVHDVFLPYEYPEPFCELYSDWGEQYLLQAMLASGPREILWPGYFVQKLRADLHEALPFVRQGRAQSFWFRA